MCDFLIDVLFLFCVIHFYSQNLPILKIVMLLCWILQVIDSCASKAPASCALQTGHTPDTNLNIFPNKKSLIITQNLYKPNANKSNREISICTAHHCNCHMPYLQPWGFAWKIVSLAATCKTLNHFSINPSLCCCLWWCAIDSHLLRLLHSYVPEIPV